MERQLLCVIATLTLYSLGGYAVAQNVALIGTYQLYEDAYARGDFATAAGHARSLTENMEGEANRDATEYAESLRRLGDALARSGDTGAAVDYIERALVVYETELGVTHPDLISILETLYRLQLGQGHYAAARATLERVLDIEVGAYGKKHPDTLATMQQLEALYRDNGDDEAAAGMASSIASATQITRSFPGDGDDRRYDASDGYATVRVFYGTNRDRTGRDKVTQFYGKERGELDLGYLDVSIPHTHKYGALESQSTFSVFTYMLGDEAKKKKYVLLQSIRPLEHDVFYDTLRDYIAGAPSNDVFLFVHGYNVAFQNAARRAAQLAYDLDFDGTPMMFSWPSQASTAAYTVDEAVVRPSGRKLARLLDGVVANSGAERIHLIAHSMGNRALIEALQTYIVEHGREDSRDVFDQIVFTAPDVDRDYFIDVVDSVALTARRATLYASANDVALRSSRIVHGAPRAGLAGSALVVLPGLETIDMSGVKADALGHSYFAANEGAIYDLFRLFWIGDAPPDRCGMVRAQTAGINYWRFDVDSCRGGELLQAGVLLKRFGAGARARIEDRIKQLTDAEHETEKQEWSRILDRLNSLIQ